MDLTSGETDSQSTMNGETTDESPANHPKEIIDEKCENDCEEVSGNFIDPAQVTEKDSEKDERDIDNNSAVSKDDVEENVIGSLVENTVKEEEKDAVEEQEEAEMTEKSRDKDSETTLKDDTTEIKPEIEEKHKDEWLDILGNGLLKKKVITTGQEGSFRPTAGQLVCIKTEGTLENGNKVDVYEQKQFILGDGDVITAWELTVPTMVEGEVCQLITASRFAYGPIGRENEESGIPPDSKITYILELISIKQGPDIGSLTDEERIQLGDQKRERGNELFRREEYSQAVYSYCRALKYLEPSTSQEVMELKVKCWNNIGASNLKVHEYAAAKKACDSVLEVQPENVKALFRKGKVSMAQGETEEALELLREASLLDPENRMVRKEFLAARQKCDEDRRKERNMYQRMVNGLGADSKEEDKSSFFTWPVILGITGVALGGILAALLLSKHQP